MLLLAGAICVATPATIAWSGVAMICLHDLLDGIRGAQLGKAGWLWFLLHQSGDAHLGPLDWFVLFPLVPWVGVMAAGYGLGLLYRPGWEPARLRWLWRLGAAALALFVVLRVAHLYGNPVALGSGGAREPFAPQGSVGMTLVSLLDVEKYPPSLQYLLMTLGLVLLALAAAERWHPRWYRPLVVFGRVPLFFYVAHLYLIHLLALVLAIATGEPWQWLGVLRVRVDRSSLSRWVQTRFVQSTFRTSASVDGWRNATTLSELGIRLAWSATRCQERQARSSSRTLAKL